MRKWLRVALVAVIVITATTSLVGAQGGTWVSGFTIQNQHPTNTANVTIKFYGAEGTPNAGVLVHTLTDTIDGGKSKTWFTPSIPGLPDGFLGSVVVESSEPVAAIINTQVPSGSGATPGDPNRVGTASGVAEPKLEMYATQVMKAYYWWNSYIAVQNTTADPALITAYYYDASGAQVLMNTQSLHAYSSYVFRQETEGLPADFNGSAKIVGDKNLAVAVPHQGTFRFHPSRLDKKGVIIFIDIDQTVIIEIYGVWAEAPRPSKKVGVKNLQSQTFPSSCGPSG